MPYYWTVNEEREGSKPSFVVSAHPQSITLLPYRLAYLVRTLYICGDPDYHMVGSRSYLLALLHSLTHQFIKWFHSIVQ